MTRRFALGAAAACALLAPTAAHAGTPFTIGAGTNPHVYTQADNGTAHLVWDTSDNRVAYCQVPRGATACSFTRDLGNAGAGPYADETYLIRRSATQIDAIMPTYAPGRTFRKTSNDNGASWSANWVEIYGQTGNMGTNSSQPFVWNNGVNDEYIVTTGSSFVFGARTDLSETGTNENADFDDTPPTHLGVDTTTVPIAEGNDLLVIGNDLSSAYFRRMTATNPSVEASWSAEQAISGPLSETRAASGPAGTFVFGSGEGVGGGRPELRKWNGANFDAPVVFDTDTAYINGLTVGPAGVAAIWRKNSSVSPGNRLQMALSGSGAPGTFGVTTVSRGTEVMSGMNVSLANDNLGWVVYEGDGGGSNRKIQLVDTTPAPEPPAPPVTPPVTPPVVVKPPVVVPPVKKTKTVKVSSNGADITLGVPNQCIPAGKPFTATLTWKKQKRKGNRFVKITRTDFYVGTKRLKIDKKAPFKQTMTIPKPKKGQTYSFKARAFIKMSKGKKVPKKSIVTKLKVCS